MERFYRICREVEKEGRLELEKQYYQHGATTVYEHSLHVASVCVWAASHVRWNLDMDALIRGALLHDYFLYDWHEPDPGHRLHGFTHPRRALFNARQDFNLKPIEENMILSHMFPLLPVLPKSKEAWLLCLADKYCALTETLSPFLLKAGRLGMRP